MNRLRTLIVWLMAAYVLCLLPSSYFDWFKPDGGVDSDTPSVLKGLGAMGNLLELAAHAILMMGIAFCLSRLLGRDKAGSPGGEDNRKKEVGLSRFFIVLVTMCTVTLIAVSIEGLQALLPESFSRGFTMSDIRASLVGGLLGLIAALVRQRRFMPQPE